jgi:hypothetical protein
MPALLQIRARIAARKNGIKFCSRTTSVIARAENLKDTGNSLKKMKISIEQNKYMLLIFSEIRLNGQISMISLRWNSVLRRLKFDLNC